MPDGGFSEAEWRGPEAGHTKSRGRDWPKTEHNTNCHHLKLGGEGRASCQGEQTGGHKTHGMVSTAGF